MSILNQLYDNIANFDINKDKKEINIYDPDYYNFGVELNKKEFKQLIDELTELHNTMID